NSLMATFTPAFVGILIGDAVSARISDVFPVMYIAMGVFVVVFFVLWAMSIPEPHITKSKESMGSLMSGAITFKHFVLGAIAIFLYVVIELGTLYILMYWLEGVPSVGITIGGFVTGTYWFLMLNVRL